MSEATFHTSESTLDDGSTVHDVFLSDETGRTLVANTPSRNTAEDLSFAMNALRDRIMECGSDRESASFAAAFEKFMAAHSKKVS